MMLRSVTIAATLALIANAANAAPPLEGLTGLFVLGWYRYECKPPSPTVAKALEDELQEKFKDSTDEQVEESRRQAEAILEDLGRARFCREIAEALKEPSSVADAQAQATLLGQLADFETRYAAARGNALLQESLAKQQEDRVCPFSQTYKLVEEWSGSLAEVERFVSSADSIWITIQLGGKTTSTSTTSSRPIIDTVAVMAPGTRVRFSGELLGGCLDLLLGKFHIKLDRITQDK